MPRIEDPSRDDETLSSLRQARSAAGTLVYAMGYYLTVDKLNRKDAEQAEVCGSIVETLDRNHEMLTDALRVIGRHVSAIVASRCGLMPVSFGGHRYPHTLAAIAAMAFCIDTESIRTRLKSDGIVDPELERFIFRDTYSDSVDFDQLASQMHQELDLVEFELFGQLQDLDGDAELDDERMLENPSQSSKQSMRSEAQPRFESIPIGNTAQHAVLQVFFEAAPRRRLLPSVIVAAAGGERKSVDRARDLLVDKGFLRRERHSPDRWLYSMDSLPMGIGAIVDRLHPDWRKEYEARVAQGGDA